MEDLLKCLDNVLFTFAMAVKMKEKYFALESGKEENLRLTDEFIKEARRHIKILIGKKKGMALLSLMIIGGNVKITNVRLLPKLRELEKCFEACESHGLIQLIKDVSSDTALFTF